MKQQSPFPKELCNKIREEADESLDDFINKEISRKVDIQILFDVKREVYNNVFLGVADLIRMQLIKKFNK